MNLFTISDMHYTQASNQIDVDGVIRMNHKGLLATNPDQTIAYAKPAYFAAQSVFAIFDDTLVRISDYKSTNTALRGLAVSAYQKKGGGQVVALWFNDAPPAEANGITRASVTFATGKFTEPVLVDLRTSTVYTITKDRWTQDAKGATFRDLPLYDSPVLIAEKSALPLVR